MEETLAAVMTVSLLSKCTVRGGLGLGSAGSNTSNVQSYKMFNLIVHEYCI